MTLAALLQARHIMLAITGVEKRDIYQRASQKTTPAMPVSYVIAQKGVPLDVYWHV